MSIGWYLSRLSSFSIVCDAITGASLWKVDPQSPAERLPWIGLASVIIILPCVLWNPLVFSTVLPTRSNCTNVTFFMFSVGSPVWKFLKTEYTLLEERSIHSTFTNHRHSLDSIYGYFNEFMEPWLSSWSGLDRNRTVIFASKVPSSWEKGSRGVDNF